MATPKRSPDPRLGAEYIRKRRAFIKRQPNPSLCVLCWNPVDMTLPGKHPWGPQVEHTVAVRHAPHLALDVSLWRIAHATCQRRQGGAARTRQRKAPAPPREPNVPQRDW